MAASHLEPAGRVRRDGGGAVLLRHAVAGVAVRGGAVIVAEAAADHTSLLEVGGAALAGVAAHAVLSAAGLEDGLAGEGLAILHVHKQPGEGGGTQRQGPTHGMASANQGAHLYMSAGVVIL